jgi:hypothetical protein
MRVGWPAPGSGTAQAGFGVGVTVQVLPSQASASVLPEEPTATQAAGDPQETAMVPRNCWPGGLGRRAIVHRPPLQRSAIPATPPL